MPATSASTADTPWAAADAPGGALPAEQLSALFEAGCLVREGGRDPELVQPASLDLTLSKEAYRLPASVLPLRGESVRDLIGGLARRSIDLSRPEILDRGKVYLVRLKESLALPAPLGAYTNSKSSVGRIDIQTRTLTDHNPRFDKVARGYRGELFLELIPKSFDVVVQEGLSLNQAIVYGRRRVLGSAEMQQLLEKEPLLFSPDGTPLSPDDIWLDDGLLMSVDLEQDVTGYVARQTTRELSLTEPGTNEPREFFEPLERPRDGRLGLRKGHFYILSTREYLRVPPGYAVEMLPYDNTAGEFRAHYAGFFDPGFGWSPEGRGRGTPAVLEVRSYDDDLILRQGQPICKMVFERMAAPPEQPYGSGGPASHYHDQRGPRLSRFFAGT